MAKTNQITVPLQQLTIGTVGPLESGLLPANLAGYVVDFQNDAAWPTDGSDVCKLIVEQSNDSGSTWAFDASITLAAAAWHDRQGTVLHTASWGVTLQNQGSNTRKIRFSVEVFKTCKLGATVSSV